jgi:hypothetical protein
MPPMTPAAPGPLPGAAGTKSSMLPTSQNQPEQPSWQTTTKNASIPAGAQAHSPPAGMKASQTSSVDASLEQKLSEASKQYVAIVQSMERALAKMRKHASFADEDTAYNDNCTRKARQFAGLDRLEASLASIKSQAGELLCDDSKTKTIVQESRQVISSLQTEQDQLDDYPQQLDSASHERRSHIYEVTIKMKCYFDQLENFRSILSDQDSTNKFLLHVLQMYEIAQSNSMAAAAMCDKMAAIDGSGREHSSHGRTRFRLQPESATIVDNGEVGRWNASEARFADLPPGSPTYFELNAATAAAFIKPDEKHRIRLSDSAVRGKTNLQPGQIFSPPQTVHPRQGWNVESSVDRDKVNSSGHFQSPRDLQSTSLRNKARENLSRFSATPEQVHVAHRLAASPANATTFSTASRPPPTPNAEPDNGEYSARRKGVSSKQTEEAHGSSPNYRAILTDFFQKSMPEKMKSLDGYFEKYKVRFYSCLHNRVAKFLV